MEQSKRILITIIIGAILILGFLIITNAITKYTGFLVSEESKETDFATCLKEQDITLYINTYNAVQTLQKTQLFDYLQHFSPSINCLKNKQACSQAGINSFPYTWVINNNKINKDISLGELSDISGCRLIE